MPVYVQLGRSYEQLHGRTTDVWHLQERFLEFQAPLSQQRYGFKGNLLIVSIKSKTEIAIVEMHRPSLNSDAPMGCHWI